MPTSKTPPAQPRRLAAVCCAALLVMTLTGCLSNYGQVRLDDAMPGIFLEGRVPPDYAYYYNGRENMPYAIIGIRPEYTLTAKFWTPLTPNTEAFKKMVRGAWAPPRFDPPVAGVLLAPDGKEIGLWYSFSPWATVQMKGPRDVAVYSPYNPGSSTYIGF